MNHFVQVLTFFDKISSISMSEILSMADIIFYEFFQLFSEYVNPYLCKNSISVYGFVTFRICNFEFHFKKLKVTSYKRFHWSLEDLYLLQLKNFQKEYIQHRNFNMRIKDSKFE